MGQLSLDANPAPDEWTRQIQRRAHNPIDLQGAHRSILHAAVLHQSCNQCGALLQRRGHLLQACASDLLNTLITERESDIVRHYRKHVVEVVRQPSCQDREFSDALEAFYRLPQIDLLGLICNDDKHPGKTQHGERHSGDMKPLYAPIRQSHANFLRLYFLACESPRDGTLFRRNLSTLGVVQLVIAAPPLRCGKVISGPEHVACGLIVEDDSSLLVNDGKSHPYIVQHSLKKSWRLKP